MGVGVVLAAAGSSQRMGGGTNKILLPLEGALAPLPSAPSWHRS